jgi:hypothetical protein
MKTLLTTKQRQVVGLILQGDVEEAKRQESEFVAIDLDRLLELLPYKTTKQSMQFTIRALIKNGLIFKSLYENRRGRQRVCFVATDLARRILLESRGLSSHYIENYDPRINKDLEEIVKAL